MTHQKKLGGYIEKKKSLPFLTRHFASNFEKKGVKKNKKKFFASNFSFFSMYPPNFFFDRFHFFLFFFHTEVTNLILIGYVFKFFKNIQIFFKFFSNFSIFF